jgi:hypothetical protein
LLVAVGSSQLNNKMISYTRCQKVFVVKIFYSSGEFRVSVERQYSRRLSVRVTPLRQYLRKCLMPEETGSVYDEKGAVNVSHLSVPKLSLQSSRQE